MIDTTPDNLDPDDDGLEFDEDGNLLWDYDEDFPDSPYLGCDDDEQY